MVCTTLDIESPIQAVCGKAARTDLGGGRAMKRASLPLPASGPGCVRTLSLPQRFIGSFGWSMSRWGSEVRNVPYVCMAASSGLQPRIAITRLML